HRCAVRGSAREVRVGGRHRLAGPRPRPLRRPPGGPGRPGGGEPAPPTRAGSPGNARNTCPGRAHSDRLTSGWRAIARRFYLRVATLLS
ncbi:MAG: hypothetical protein E6J28_10245, partial [Chloroflexi bacterium]